MYSHRCTAYVRYDLQKVWETSIQNDRFQSRFPISDFISEFDVNVISPSVDDLG